MPTRFAAALVSTAFVLVACSSPSAAASSHTPSHARQLTLSTTSGNDLATESHSGSLQPATAPSTAAPNATSVVATRTRARRPPTPAPAGGSTRTRLRYITTSVSLASSDSVSASSSGLHEATVSPSATPARPPAPGATTQAPARPSPRPAPPNSGESVSPSNVEGTASVPVAGGPTGPGSTAAVGPASTTPGGPPSDLTTAAPPPTALPPTAPRTHTAAARRGHTLTLTAADAETLSVSKLPTRSRPAHGGPTPATGLTTANAAPATTVRPPPPPTDARPTPPPVAPLTGTRAAAQTLSPTAADAETLSVSRPLPQTVTTTALPDRGQLPPGRRGQAAADHTDVPVLAAGIGAALVAVLVGVIVVLVAVPALLRSWRRRRQSGGGAKESAALPMEERTNKYRWYDDAEAVAGDVEARTVPDDLLPGATAMLLQVPVPSGAPLAGEGAFSPAVTGTVVAPPIPCSEDAIACAAPTVVHQAVKTQRPANPLPEMSML